MSDASRPVDWAAIPYHLASPATPPQVVCEPGAGGQWRLRSPVPLGHGLENFPKSWWQWFARHAHATTPMLAQRSATGAWRTLSWQQAHAQALRVATALRRMGLGPGRPLAILSGNAIEQGVLRMAALAAGVPLMHCSPAWSLLSQDFAALRSAFERVPPAAVFVQDAPTFARALGAVAEGLPVVCVARAEAGMLSWEQWLQTEPDPGLPVAATADTLASVYFTSGSTGTPKAVPVTQGMLNAQVAMTHSLADPLPRGPQAVVDWLPWHHVFAGVANLGRLLVNGGTYTIDEGRPVPGQFEATLRNLRDVAPTTYASSPLALMMLAAALEADEALARHFFSRLQSLAYGGASLPAETWERWQRLALKYLGKKVPFLSGMGSTETSAAGMALYYLSDDQNIVGLPWPGVELKLLPLEGQQGTRDGRFELRMRGPQVFRGYLGQPELTAKAFDDEGFYKLGDAVRFADPANPLKGLQFAGRVAEDFKLASGTWVSAGALRLQAVSLLSPLVSDAVVCGSDRPFVGLLAWPNEAALRALHEELVGQPLADLVHHPRVLAAVAERLNKAATHSQSTTVERVLLLATPPTLDSGEITDKGYVNQGRAQQLRAADLARLFAEPPDAAVACRQA